jgi:hypothetical protein
MGIGIETPPLSMATPLSVWQHPFQYGNTPFSMATPLGLIFQDNTDRLPHRLPK